MARVRNGLVLIGLLSALALLGVAVRDSSVEAHDTSACVHYDFYSDSNNFVDYTGFDNVGQRHIHFYDHYRRFFNDEGQALWYYQHSESNDCAWHPYSPQP